jgi:hypothetical protein
MDTGMPAFPPSVGKSKTELTRYSASTVSPADCGHAVGKLEDLQKADAVFSDTNPAALHLHTETV